MCRIISIVNMKGGVGKSTTAVNLGIGLAKQGKKVLLLDCDSQGSLTASLGFRKPSLLEPSIATVMVLRGKLRAAETAAYFRRYSLPDCACGHQTAHNHYDERRASVTC